MRKLDVAFEGDAYVVNAVFFAPAPPKVAWDVLTDFDKLQGWVPNVAESKVVKREDSVVTVEQRGVAKYGAASFPYTTERRIELKPPAGIKTAQVKGNMKRVESTMRSSPTARARGSSTTSRSCRACSPAPSCRRNSSSTRSASSSPRSSGK